MPVVDKVHKTEDNTSSNVTIVHADNFEDLSEVAKDQQINELKDALHSAFDMLEGKKPRKTINDILNG